jgi:hypothetical protein
MPDQSHRHSIRPTSAEAVRLYHRLLRPRSDGTRAQRTGRPRHGEDDRDEIDQLTEELTAIASSKIGGWHTTTQGPAFSEADRPFVFQIASEPKVGLNWVDGGILGISLRKGPDGAPRWDPDLQFF